MITVKDILGIAQAEIGVKESPANSNNVKYNTWYYSKSVSGSGYPWCMVFVQWCFAQAGVKLPVKTASCGALMQAAKAAGYWVTSGLHPGDIVIYDFPGGGTTDHCGIVESVTTSGVVAIEGNTSQAGSQSNGGMVCRKTRPNSQIVGAVRPNYTVEEVKEMRYNKISDMPGYAKATIIKMVDKGFIGGSGKVKDENNRPADLDLSMDMIRVFVINDRAGVYGN